MRRSAHRKLGVALCALIVAGLAGAGAAQAALVHTFDSYMGGGALSTPESLAVDQASGDLYVLEHGTGCVARFHGERGGPEALEPHAFPATGTNKICGFEFREEPSTAQVAVDNSGTSTQGYFYVNSPKYAGGLGVTIGFDDEGNKVTELTPRNEAIDFYYVCGVTVDVHGRVYVSERYAGVQVYEHNAPVTNADYVESYNEGPTCGIGVDSHGTHYSSWDSNGPLIENGRVLRDVSHAIAVDHSSDDVYISEGPAIEGVGPDGVVFDEFARDQITESRGIAVDETNGVAYVADTPNGRVAVFSGSTAYRLTVDLDGTGLGAVSANHPPIAGCGDEGQCVGYYLPSTVVLKAVPQPHSVVDGWTGCDTINPAGDECTLAISNVARGVAASFRRLQRPVTAATAGSGTGSVSVAAGQGAIQECGAGGACTGPYDEGAAIELVATPGEHSTFSGWSGACTNQTGPCDLVVEGSPSATAHFTAQHPVSIKKAGNGAGAVVSSPLGLDCGGVCVDYFTDGTSVILSAVPSGDSTFTGWEGQGCSGTGTCQVEAGGETKSVTATFAHDSPSAVTDAGATFIGQRVATVSGSVNPNGAKVTRCVVEFGSSASYGAERPCAPSAVGSGDVPVPVGVNLTGLAPGTTYHYRLSATSIGGTAYGADQTLRTLDDSCDTNAALCPPPDRIRKEVTQPTKPCRKGFVRKKGNCVKKKRKPARHHRRGGEAR